MAIVNMSKIRLYGLKKDNDETLEILSKFKYFHQEPAKLIEGLKYVDNSEQTEEVLSKKAKLAFAIDYIKKQNLDVINIKKKNKEGADCYLQPAKISSGLKQVDSDSIFDVEKNSDEIFAVADEIEKISLETVDLTSLIKSLDSQKKGYELFKNFPMKLNTMRDTKYSSIIVAANSSIKNDISFEGLNVEYQEYGTSPKVVCAVCLKEDKKSVIERLTQSGYLLCPYDEDITASQKILELEQKKAGANERKRALTNRVLALSEHDFDLKLLYDFYSLKGEQITADKTSAKSEYTFIIDGWVPTEKVEVFKKKLFERIKDICVDVSEPTEDDLPPTCTKNNGFVAPFEGITLMYTVPNYRESDPNPPMAFWYFFLFGIMTGDFVYGLGVTAICALALMFFKLNSGMKNFIKMFFWCGISSTLWGLAFGSFAGFSLPLQKELPVFSYADATGTKFYLGWFNPMEKPIMLLGLSLALGIAQLLCGFVLKFIGSIKDKHPLDALCDAMLPGLFLVSILLLGSDIFINIFKNGAIDFGAKVLPKNIGSTLKDVGMYTLLIAIGLIFLTGGRKAKSIGGYFGGGLNGLYGIINLTADILSYARLFGLGLAGAAIAFAFNTLVETIFLKNIVMLIIGIGVSIVLHIFNLAISLLGTYVHNARLQLLEFYGKFLVGDGKLFKPLGRATKYTEIKD